MKKMKGTFKRSFMMLLALMLSFGLTTVVSAQTAEAGAGGMYLENTMDFSDDYSIGVFSATVTGVTASPTSLNHNGGDSTVTVTGTDLVPADTWIAVVISGSAPLYQQLSSGTATSVSADISFPANVGTTNRVYTIYVSLDGAGSWTPSAATVTVTPPPVVTGLAATPTSFNHNGGDSTVTVTGTDLDPADTRIAAFLNDTGAPLYMETPTGTASNVSADLAFPANTGTTNRVYTIRVSLDGGTDWEVTPIAAVTVTPPPVVTNLTASPTSFSHLGGDSTITVTGTDLDPAEIRIAAFLNNAGAPLYEETPTGSATSVTADLAFPENTTNANRMYLIQISMDGGTTWAAHGTVAVTVGLPPAATGVVATPTSFTHTGGSSTITIAGSNLTPSDIRIAAFLNNVGTPLYTATPTGTSTIVSADLAFPINTGVLNRIYTIQISLDGGATWIAPSTITVTVAPPVLPPAEITAVTATPTSIAHGGGDSTITVTGNNLNPSRVRIAAFLNNAGTPLYVQTPTGDASTVSADLVFPANTGTAYRIYTIRVSLDGGNNWEVTSLTAIMVAPPAVVPPAVTGLTADLLHIPHRGGNSVITVVGNNLNPSNTRIAAFFNNTGAPLYMQTPTGTASSVRAMLTFPANTSTVNRSYTVRVSLDEGATWAVLTTMIAVAHPGVALPGQNGWHLSGSDLAFYIDGVRVGHGQAGQNGKHFAQGLVTPYGTADFLFNNQGHLLTGLRSYGNQWHYFHTTNGTRLLSGVSGWWSWQLQPGQLRYLHANGTWAEDELITIIWNCNYGGPSQATYLFDADGFLVTDFMFDLAGGLSVHPAFGEWHVMATHSFNRVANFNEVNGGGWFQPRPGYLRYFVDDGTYMTGPATIVNGRITIPVESLDDAWVTINGNDFLFCKDGYLMIDGWVYVGTNRVARIDENGIRVL